VGSSWGANYTPAGQSGDQCMASRKYNTEASSRLDAEENRIFCDHCLEYVHRSTYWRHQSLLDPATAEHVTTFDINMDSNEDSSASLSESLCAVETIGVDGHQCDPDYDIPHDITTDSEVANDITNEVAIAILIFNDNCMV